jgi:pyruvate/2-oxoglutarate dehydrogenase complex dihydrolipoamide dehydrogenase (E3) component
VYRYELEKGGTMTQFDVIVIGGGTAGLVTASGCARLGRRVALIEREKLGGDCLWTGCVPTKALVASAKLLHQMRHAHAWGIDDVSPKFSPKSILDSMRAARDITAKHDDPEKFRRLGIEVIQGDARLVSESDVEVNGRHFMARDIVLATGSRTAVPPVDGLSDTGFVDHVSFLDRDEFPRSVIVLGGGYIGIEFAQMLRRFGAQVTVVEMLDEIVNKEDADVIERVHAVLRDEGIEVLTGWKVTSVRPGKIASIENEVHDRRELRADEIFVASGRRGNIENLGLDAIGVKTERSYIVVDKFLQTSVPRIWAAGDVHGGLQFTHVAAYEAVKLVRNILFPGKSAVTYDDVPWALYTDPEVGHIGVTEREARKLGEVRTYKVEMYDVDRAVVDRTTAGFLKLVCDDNGRILGAHAMCSNASTLIEQLVIARKKRMKIGEIAQLVSPYPSLADAVQKAASLYYQDVAKGWLGGLGRRVAAWSQ